MRSRQRPRLLFFNVISPRYFFFPFFLIFFLLFLPSKVGAQAPKKQARRSEDNHLRVFPCRGRGAYRLTSVVEANGVSHDVT